MIEFNSISLEIAGKLLLSNISFHVKKNSIHAILGQNGAGKSTLMKLALGLIKPTSGSIKISDMPICNTRGFLKSVGSLIEGVGLYSHLTVYENLLVCCLQHNLKSGRISEVLGIVGLEAEYNKRAKDLSIGMKQRLGIGMAIIHSPTLILLDEPTNGLDPQGVVKIRELLKFLNATLNVTILFASHMLAEVDKIANDVSLIQNGSLVFSGSLVDFKNSNDIELDYFERIQR